MTQPAQPAARRGRRDPNLLQGEQTGIALTQDSVGGDGKDGFVDDPEITLLYEGDTITATLSAPVTFEGMDRYSLAGGEAHITVQPGEDGYHAAARARAAVRLQFFDQIEEMEESLAAYAEQKAQEAARMQQALARQ